METTQTILELEPSDPEQASSIADQYFALDSWSSDGEERGIVYDRPPDPQQEEGNGSYRSTADETGIFMETTAACVRAGEDQEDWMLGIEEQRSVQIVLNIKDHGGNLHGMVSDDPNAALRQMRIPLLALDGIADQALSQQGSQISLTGEVPLFSYCVENHEMHPDERDFALEALGTSGKINVTIEDGDAADGSYVIVDHGDGDGEGFIQELEDDALKMVVREETSLVSYAFVPEDGLIFEAADSQALPSAVKITEYDPGKEEALEREQSPPKGGTTSRSSLISATSPRKQNSSLDRVVDLRLISLNGIGTGTRTMVDQSKVADSVVDSCSFSMNNSSSGCDTEFYSAYKPVIPRKNHTGSLERKRSRRSSQQKTGYERKKPFSKLPTAAKEILTEWLEANRTNPYPTPAEKNLLAIQTGLRYKQVENWMSNARAKHHIQKNSKCFSRCT